jgi:glycosyltransferase involved in cell wall biosynthesis
MGLALHAERAKAEHGPGRVDGSRRCQEIEVSVTYTILMVAPTSFFADYGCHVRIWEEIKALQKLGHRVVMTTYHNGDDMPGIDIRRSWDLPWIKRAMVGSSRHKLYLDMALSWRTLRVALALRPTLVHAHLHEGALIGGVVARMLRVPLIFDYQGSLTAEMVDHGFLGREGALLRGVRRLERRINLQADALITSTYNAARMIREDFDFPAERLFTVADSVDTDRFRPFDETPEWRAARDRLKAELGIPPERKVIAYLGLLAPYQGTNVLLEAARSVVERRPDAHFLIMGYPDVRPYRELAEHYGIGDHVTLPGRIMYKDAHTYLALGNLAVAPKMSATEGAGKITNYMAMGLPVVTFDTPVSYEILGDTGIYARFGSAESLADKLLMALDHPIVAGHLGFLGREKAVQEHSWALASSQISAIYEHVLATRRGELPGAALEQARTIERQRQLGS